MKRDQFRADMESCRRDAEAEASLLKDVHSVVERLGTYYRGLGADERELANQVLREWVSSPDEGRRFDALALIDEFAVVDAAAALQELAGRLESSGAPSAPYELAKVTRVLEALTKAN